MKPYYIATFIVGFEQVISEQLQEDAQATLHEVGNGLVVFSTHTPYSQLEELPYLKSVFTDIFHADQKEFHLDQMITKVTAAEVVDRMKSLKLKKGAFFKIVVSRENVLQPLPQRIYDVQRTIEKNTGLIFNNERATIEFWLMYRTEGTFYFAVRKIPEREFIHKGELRPELAHTLVLLSDPKPTDVVYDPFTGFGAIGMARKKYPYTKIILNDIMEERILHLKKRLMRNPKVDFYIKDYELVPVDDNSVDVVITDPPWGEFDRNINPKEFYPPFLRHVYRVLKPNGRCILLVNRDEEIERAVQKNQSQLRIMTQYDLLLSGKKARVYLLQKGN